MDWIRKLKPGVNKFWLDLLSGLMWSGVGIFLISLTREWVPFEGLGIVLAVRFAGVLLGLAIWYWGFSRLAKRNIIRIEAIASDKPCVFAFQGWTSYPLVAVMISLGIFMRVYSPIPKWVLAIGYVGIGQGLFLSSLYYYQHLWTGNDPGGTN